MDFVVGHPRSGTALVAAILNAGGTRRVAEHEWLAKLSSLSIAAASEYYERRRSRESVVSILEHYRYGDGTPVRVDSNWKLSYILDVVLAEYPRARVLHLQRNPIDNVGACVGLDFYGDPGRRLRELDSRNYWLSWMPRIDRADWDGLSQLERNCAFWCETHRLVLAQTAAHPTVMTARLEDLDVPLAHRIRAFFDLERVEDEAIECILSIRHNDRVAIRKRLAEERELVWPPQGDEWAQAIATIDRMTGELATRFGYRAGSRPDE